MSLSKTIALTVARTVAPAAASAVCLVAGVWAAAAPMDASRASAPAAAARHAFDLTYRSFGPVEVTSGYLPGRDYDLRPEGCYARASTEAICGFTLRARAPITVTNADNVSHAQRADGAFTRTCCIFVAGDPNGYPLTAPGVSTEGARRVARRLNAGDSLALMLRIPDYATGAPIAAVTFSRGGGDPGVTTQTTVKDLTPLSEKGPG